MKAAVLTSARSFEIQDIPEPDCGKGQAVITPFYTGICGTDQHIFNGEFEERVSYPAVLGHEFGGIIAAIGSEVSLFKEGDRVVVDPVIPCRMCRACHEGKLSSCVSLKLRGVDLPGGMAEKVVADENQLFLYPDDLPLEWAPMAELYSIACHAAVRAQLKPADTVVIMGAGKVGLAITDVFSNLGTERIVVVDPVPERLAVSEQLGADVVINPEECDPVEAVAELTGGTGADLVVEAVGHFENTAFMKPPVAAAGEIVRNGGRLVILGQGPQETSVLFKPLVWKEIEIIMSRVSRGEFYRSVSMMKQGKLHPDLIITGVYPLEDLEHIFLNLEKDKSSNIKAILKIC